MAHMHASLPAAASAGSWPCCRRALLMPPCLKQQCCCALQRSKPLQVKWVNQLVDGSGRYLQHMFADQLEQTLHWWVAGRPHRQLRVEGGVRCLAA